MLDKDKQQGINYNYTCIEDFSAFPIFNDMGEKFGLDSHVLVEIIKTLAAHVDLPKENFIIYVEPVKPPNMAHAYDPPTELVATIGANDYCEKPPYTAKI
jgi:hypothetical protein